MNETSKASIRRRRDQSFVTRFFVGNGIDIGAGEDSLAQQLTRFTKIKSVRSWDVYDGDAQYLEGVLDDQFDFVYSSHCLEDLENPLEALKNWLRVTKPGGFLIVSVPDEDMYEHGIWPSIHNADHSWSFTISKSNPRMPKSIQVIDLIRQLSNVADCERIHLVSDHYEPTTQLIDQTLGIAECAIEIVLRKKLHGFRQLMDLAIACEQAGKFAEAMNYCQGAINLEPTQFEAINFATNLLSRSISAESALDAWDQYLQLKPTSYESQYFRALHLLSMGRYDEGFQARDPLVPDARRTPITPPVNYPRWEGQSLQGKRIAIWTEFGLGDEIMFARFASQFKDLGASLVALVCQKPLVALMAGLADVDLVVSSSQAENNKHIKDLDYWVFPHSIPAYYSLNKFGVPQKLPYIEVSAATKKKAALKLTAEKVNRLKVGLAYQGNPTHENDRLRSVFDLRSLAPIFKIQGIDWVILQNDNLEKINSDLKVFDDLEQASITIVGDKLGDLLDTAAICTQLDLVVSVDTAVAHLAGALNIPVFLLLPTFCDWRWGIDQTISSWYPKTEIFRQHITGLWNVPVERVATRLSEELAKLMPKQHK
ncbi:methyltransferase domain-containing protein [Polynucleobacter paneuropaeus]|uniref:Methyltransferase type 11 n=1 Tax=Polynucleobacter paneuropaeus TaxID=2527775 RepID=A0A2Z4JSI5_9BURK|nr:methyltransferase domain-containing protein [Polynucleobacter paneuropaeus]AWW49653.1 methyltransferase type 11 [Polynucleobacter paneuropaeus]MBT8564650.1 methyltransferase domain-containing protein [Polynucleobacter paneuropaeus]